MLDIAILDGARTPFVKSFGPLRSVAAQHLGTLAARAALLRCSLSPSDVDQVIFGNAATPPEAANIARVIALMAGVPQDRIAHTVQRNCASGMEAITTAAQLLQLGEAGTILAGGTESMSQIPLLYDAEATSLFLRLRTSKTTWQKLRTILQFRPRHLLHPIPAVKLGLTDPVSGLPMGETAEVLAEEFGITRQEQDAFALESHRRAASAMKRGVLEEELFPIKEDIVGREIDQDIGPRADQSMEALSKLKPYFKENGTVTVGNSCPLTDGAAALLLMSGEMARARGLRPLGYLRGYAYAGCDPRRMGLGPAYATSKLLTRTGLKLQEIDLMEMNEAFAAQILANLRAFSSIQFAREELGRGDVLGEIDPSKLNVNGGAIALGHPVGATGARLVLTLLTELRRRNLPRGLATLCAAGGQGAALLLESS
jgi:acetyl-CoA acetyltransferase family protein